MPSTRVSDFYPFLQAVMIHEAASDAPLADDEVGELFTLVHVFIRRLLRPERLTIPNSRLDFNSLSDADCNFTFRFTLHEIKLLADALDVPGTVIAPDRSRAADFEVVAIALARLAFPSRWGGLVRLFGRSERSLSSLYWHLAKDLVRRFYGIMYLDPDRIRPLLPVFAAAIKARGAPLDQTWGFIDGTARPVARPVKHQKAAYSGHKRKHCLKFQQITTPDGINAHLYGPLEGRRADAFMLVKSQIQPTLEREFPGWIVYGDPAYPLTNCIVAGFKGSDLTPAQEAFNKAMSTVRESVEWGFREITANWQHLDWKRNQRLLHGPGVAMEFYLGFLLTNCRTCIKGRNMISDYFGLSPPSINQYLRNGLHNPRL
jgi:hypothetical protein